MASFESLLGGFWAGFVKSSGRSAPNVRLLLLFVRALRSRIRWERCAVLSEFSDNHNWNKARLLGMYRANNWFEVAIFARGTDAPKRGRLCGLSVHAPY